MFPVSVQTCLPRLSSIHRSFGTYDLSRTKKPPSFKPGGTYGLEEPSLLTKKPFPMKPGFVHPFSASSSSSSRSPSPPPGAKSAQSGGTSSPDWKYAKQGLSMLSTAVSEAHSIPQSLKSSSLSRQLYVHSLAYLLQALPTDLTVPEKACLCTAIPLSLVPSNPEAEQQALIVAPTSQHGHRPSPSFLHRLLASTIIHLFLLFQLLLPYLRLFLRYAYRYERTHHVTERVLVGGIEAADALGDVVNGVLWKGNGRVGNILAGAVGWWVDGICGGVQEGVGVGMARIGDKSGAV